MRAAITCLLAVATLTGCSVPRQTAPYRTIFMQAQIDIHRPIEQVFAFAANPLNDGTWRPEVRDFTASGPLQAGTFYGEVIHIGLRNHYQTKAVVSQLTPPFLIRVKAAPGHDRTFVADRTFAPLSPGWTRVTYRAQADERVVYDLTFLPVGLDQAAAYYQWVMKQNLFRLKRILEQDSAG